MSKDSKLGTEDTVLALAAAVTERACELIDGGWTKGRMATGAGGVQQFCIHGAINLAMEEVFGEYNRRQAVQTDVEDVAVAYICDEAFGKMQSHSGGIPAAAYNDAGDRRHDEVIGVLDRAATRLWDLAVDPEATPTWQPSKWADGELVSEDVRYEYLHATLGN